IYQAILEETGADDRRPPLAAENKQYVRRFLALAEAHRIRVFWLIPPIHPVVQGVRDKLGRDGPFQRFIREEQARFPDLVVIDGRRSGYHPDLFVDSSHLNIEGTTTFSVDVADVVRRAPGGGGPR